MHPQRVREAESRAVRQFVKWAAEGALKGEEKPSIMRRKTHVSCQEYDSIPLRARFLIVKQGGTAGEIFGPVLDRQRSSVLDGSFLLERKLTGQASKIGNANTSGKKREVLYVSNI